MNRICPLVRRQCLGSMCVAFKESIGVYEGFSIVKGKVAIKVEEIHCLALNVELDINQEEALKRKSEATE
jgi:hypothetical protein